MDKSDRLRQVLAAWELSAEQGMLPAPSSDVEFDSLRATGIDPPSEFRRAYECHNGGEFFGGNLNVWPLTGKVDTTVEKFTNALRENGVPIPNELVLFGDNGQFEYFGFWVARTKQQKRWPVLHVGISEQPAMSIVATDFERFLLGWSAIYALVCEESQEVIDALGVPVDLRSLDPDDATVAAIWQWADPGYPQTFGRDPYAFPLSPERISDWVSK